MATEKLPDGDERDQDWGMQSPRRCLPDAGAIYVAPLAHRTGVGRSLYRPLLSILHAQGFHSAFAGISLPNAGSIGLHEAMGFSPVGIYPNVGFKHGKWHFMGWWGLEIRRSHERPTEPLPLLSIDIAPYLVR